MADRLTPAGTVPTTGEEFMDDVRGEFRENWKRSPDLLVYVSGTNDIIVTATITITVYEAPLSFYLVAGATNTGAMTIDINGIGPVSLLDAAGQELGAGMIVSGRAYPVAYISGAFRVLSIVGIPLAVSRVVEAANHQTDGTAGGTATAGSYQTYPLNTMVRSELSAAGLSSNQVTLPPGTYKFRAAAPFYDVGRARLRLYNVTDATFIDDLSATVDANAGDATQVLASCEGRFTLSATKTLELRYRVQTTNADDGLGLAASFGETERYGYVQFERQTQTVFDPPVFGGSGVALLDATDQLVTGGSYIEPLALNGGTPVTSGAITPDPGDRFLQHYTNGGAHDLDPIPTSPTLYGAYWLDVINNASAGVIGLSNWSNVIGSFDTGNGNGFRCQATFGPAGSLLIIQAMQ